MNLSVFLNSKFAVALAIAFPVVIPATILVSKMPAEDTAEAFNHMVDAIKAKFVSEKKEA